MKNVLLVLLDIIAPVLRKPHGGVVDQSSQDLQRSDVELIVNLGLS